MLSTSREKLRWAVAITGRRYLIEVAWPGFDNWVAVDGSIVLRWSWPGNNLCAGKSFAIEGIVCSLTRRRTGLFSYAFELSAPGAVVEATDPVGIRGRWHPSRILFPFGWP